MKRFLTKEVLFLLAVIIIFLFIRSVYFADHLNFSSDQGEHATQVLEYFRSHKLPLIGNPITSVQYQGRLMYQGPAYYYMLFIFLFLGNFDPLVSSYLFTIFCALMILPLYYGTKMLLNRRAAILMVIIYTCLPYYVNYTRFHWNPTYQLSLLPILILFMGLYKKTKQMKWFWAVSIWLGVLLHFHYQFFFVIIGMAAYYFLFKRLHVKYLGVFVGGLLVGLSPLILFELKNHFYNLNTLILFITHRKDVQTAGGASTPHYYLSFSFMALLAVLGLLQNRLPKGKVFVWISGTLAAILFIWSALLNFHKPAQAFWSMAPNWSYPNEYKVYSIIKSTHLNNYNIANLTYYDTYSAVIKYLLKRDKVDINYADYYQNKYLFVINTNDRFHDKTPYEVDTFKPSKLLKTWKINNMYNLYLLERTKE